MVHPQLKDEGYRLHIWRVGVNIPNNVTDNQQEVVLQHGVGGSSEVLTPPRHKKPAYHKMLHRALDFTISFSIRTLQNYLISLYN